MPHVVLCHDNHVQRMSMAESQTRREGFGIGQCRACARAVEAPSVSFRLVEGPSPRHVSKRQSRVPTLGRIEGTQVCQRTVMRFTAVSCGGKFNFPASHTFCLYRSLSQREWLTPLPRCPLGLNWRAGLGSGDSRTGQLWNFSPQAALHQLGLDVTLDV